MKTIDDDIGYESGPYCIHWCEPWECEEKCACGHNCARHYGGYECEDCDCEEFAEVPRG